MVRATDASLRLQGSLILSLFLVMPSRSMRTRSRIVQALHEGVARTFEQTWSGQVMEIIDVRVVLVNA